MNSEVIESAVLETGVCVCVCVVFAMMECDIYM